MNPSIKIFYWSPFISKIATIKAVLNSAKILGKFSKNLYNVSIINSIGEFEDYEEELKDTNVKLINLFKKKIAKYFSDKGFVISRVSFMIISIITFFPLLKVIKQKKPDFLIIHLLTSLPLILNYLFNLNTKIILRISGYPKLNRIRLLLWKILLKKVYAITCPTEATRSYLISLNLTNKEKFLFLADPILDTKKINKLKKEKINDQFGDYFFSAGRLTKQKNYNFLIKNFSEVIKMHPKFKLLIAGSGEEEINLNKQIKKNNLEGKVILLGYCKNVYKYMNNSICFILSSLWEDPGFVLVEAIFCRTSIISSDCPNGPREILMNGEGGYLYESNKSENFKEKLFTFLDDIKNNNKKIILKKKNSLLNIRKYTFLRHYIQFNEILKSI